MPYHTAQYQVCTYTGINVVHFVSWKDNATDLYAIMIMTCISTLDKSSFMFILLLCFDSLSPVISTFTYDEDYFGQEDVVVMMMMMIV